MMIFLGWMLIGLLGCFCLIAWITAWKCKVISDILHPVYSSGFVRILLVFLPAGWLLCECFPFLRKPGEKICAELQKAFPGSRGLPIFRQYMEQMISLGIMTALLAVGMMVMLAGNLQESRDIGYVLERPSFEEGEQTQTIVVETENVQTIVSLKIEPLEPTTEQAVYQLEQAEIQFKSILMQLGTIHRTAQLPKQIGKAAIRYRSEYPLILDASGTVRISSRMEETGVVEAEALLTIGEEERRIPFTIPYDIRSEKTVRDQIREGVQGALPSEEQVLLPKEVWLDGEWKKAVYKTPDQTGNVYLWELFLGSLPILCILYMRERLKDSNKKRNRKIREAYPFAVQKLSVYLGSGLSVAEAWSRTAENGRQTEPLICEMMVTLKQIRNGEGMQDALWYFGKRTQIPELRRLASVLSENLKRGDRYLLENMQHLNQEAWEQHKRDVRIRSEEAQTKLLFPMMLMLVVVLVLILTPALITMNAA